MTEVDLRKQDRLVVRPAAELVPVTRRQRVYARYASSPSVPVVLKTRRMDPAAPASRRHALGVTVRSIVMTFPLAVTRGVTRVVTVWWRWSWCMEERAQAREEGKLHSSAAALRNEAKYRWIGNGVTLLVTAVTLLLLWRYDPGWWLLALGAVVTVLLAVMGRRNASVTLASGDVRGARWLVDASHFAEGLREANLLGKDDNLRVVSPPMSDNGGWSMVVDLPGALMASKVIAARESLAAAFDVDEESLVLERDRGERGHAARLGVWACPQNPFRRAPSRFPLLDVERASVWTEHPFGIDARGRVVNLSLMWSSMMIAARPRRGKTAASRVVAAPFVLDPSTEIMCFNGKPSSDWDDLEPLCTHYIRGAKTDDCLALLQALRDLGEEVDASYERLARLPLEDRPDHKLTESISSVRSNKLPVRLVIIDEVHIYLEEGRSTTPKGETPLGKLIADELIDLAKRASAVGVILLLITQRPSSDAIPTELSRMIGTRFGLKVEGYRDSNMILGDGMSTMGYDCSKLVGIPGVGIFVPDGDQTATDIGFPTLRTYYVGGQEWKAICERGLELRGRFPGPSVAQAAVPVLEADVVPHPLDAVVEAFSGRERMAAGELGAALKLSPNGLAELMKGHQVEKHRDNRGKYYLLSDVRAAL